jgi:aspartate racemase
VNPFGPEWKRVIGVVGGLGPYAHVEFERQLLAATALRLGRTPKDQDYPDWVLVSVPGTPDRTLALRGEAADPVPNLTRAVKMLDGVADFAVIACNSAHAFLDEVRMRTQMPILDMIELTAEHVTKYGDTIGLLATTGTLDNRLFAEAASRAGIWVEFIAPSDLPDGDALQRELVMNSVYGPVTIGDIDIGGIKAGALDNVVARDEIVNRLTEAALHLIDRGAKAIVMGCTEIPLALGHGDIEGIPLIDPMRVAAEAAVAIAAGERPLPV